MRYIVYGAGAIGGVIGGRLAEHGADVVLIARGAHLEALRASGLCLRDPLETTYPPAAVAGSIEEAAPEAEDVVILTMKTQDTEQAVSDLAACAPPQTAVVCGQNGIANERISLRRMRNVHGMCVMLPASYMRPGTVHAESAPCSGVLDVGRYPQGRDDVDEQLVADLRAARFDAYVDGDVMRWKHTKLLANLGNALEAAAGQAARGSELYKLARLEGEACLAAARLPWAGRDEEREHRKNMSPLGTIDGESRGGGSSWQSLARRTGRIEADWLNGEIVLLGRIHGIPTPVNETLQRLANHLARSGRAPGSMALEEIEAQV